MAASQEKEAAFYHANPDGTVKCELCPNNCLISQGKTGSCGARKNVKGKLVSVVYGHPCSTHIDPVEKKPLLHFLPGSTAFSLGTLGCNLHCKHCQNYSISQVPDVEDQQDDHLVPPQAIVDAAIRNGCKSIAYTYNEPTIFYEYVLEIAKLAKQKGLKNLMITNGYINSGPLDELYPYIDAANVDLKAFTEDFYKKVCGAKLSSVLETLERLHTKHPHVWIEIAYLVIPGHNDSVAEISQAAQWIKEHIGPHVPLHLSRFFPKYKLNTVPPTPERTLIEAAKAAKEHLQYVYVGNISIKDGELTSCHVCSAPLIDREGYDVSLRESWDTNGQCGRCGSKIPGVWA